MKPELNLYSSRAKLARFSVTAERINLGLLLFLTSAIFVVFGSSLLLADIFFGWAVIGFATWPLMGLIADRWWIREVPPRTNPRTIDDLLSGDLLGLLRDQPSPKQIAEGVMQCSGGHFFAIRFGIGARFLIEMSSAKAEDSQAVWEKVLELNQDTGYDAISPAMVLVALIYQMPEKEQILAKLQLSVDDLNNGLIWYHHLSDLVKLSKDTHIKGGIGRDMSFGYTPRLERFALNISNFVGAGNILSRHLEGHVDAKKQLITALSASTRPHMVLVGPLGAGKTAVIHSLAVDLINPPADIPHQIRFNQIYSIDPSTLIAHASKPGELEALINALLVEASKAKNIIIFLDNAELFFREGTGSVDLSSVLLPILEESNLKIIMAMDEQAWLELSRGAAAVTQRLQRINISPLEERDTMLVCENHLITTEFKYRITYMYQALRAAYRMGKRYVSDEVMPGQAIKILEDAAQYNQNGLVTESSIEQVIENTYGVKVANANTQEEKDNLLNLESNLHQRMVNQSHAVKVVSNALRRARSGVRNPDRPIGSFLFLGPTGVGKTELSKALAAVFFGGEDRLVRIDLNEFGQPEDVARLIDDGTKDAKSLVAQISKQPFSVVLFDEIEKAHPNVLDTLLQLLDEGVLRDTNNREISFRDAIIIATSNAGANTIREAIEAGMTLESIEDSFVDGLITAQKFKPEFLNRFDEIVLFRPLNKDELLQVLDLILTSVNKILASQHVTVNVAQDAKLRLVEEGNDPRLGARPMRRMVQRTVENIVANRLLSSQVAPGEVMQINLADVEGALKE